MVIKPTIRRVTEAQRQERMRILTTAERAALPTREERERRAAEAKAAIEEREAEIELGEKVRKARERERRIDIALGRIPVGKPAPAVVIPTQPMPRGPAITQAIQARAAIGVPTATFVEAQRAFKERQAAISARIPTLEAIQVAGREFAVARPTVARGLFGSLEFGAMAARRVIPEEVGVPVGEFAVGAFRGLQEKPLKAAAFFGATLAAGPALRGIGAIGRAAGVPQVLAPVTAPITRVPGITRLPTLAIGGLFAKTIEEEITAPVAITAEGVEIPPTAAEMARRAGMIFTTEIAPIAAGVGVGQLVSPLVQKIRMERAFRRLEPTPITTVGISPGRRPLPSEVRPFEMQRILRFGPTGVPRITTITRRPPKLLPPEAKIEFPTVEPFPKPPVTTGQIKITEEIPGIKITRPVEITTRPPLVTVTERRRALRPVEPITKIPFLKAEEAEVSLIGRVTPTAVERPAIRPLFGEAAFGRGIIPTPSMIFVKKPIEAPPSVISVVTPLLATVGIQEILQKQRITPLKVQIPKQIITPLKIQIPTVGQIQEMVQIPERIQRQRIVTVPARIVEPITAVEPVPRVRPLVAAPPLPFAPFPIIPPIPKKPKKKDLIKKAKRRERKFEKLFEIPIASPFRSVGRIK